MVLYCVPKLRLMGQKFSVRERIDIAGMEVQICFWFWWFYLVFLLEPFVYLSWCAWTECALFLDLRCSRMWSRTFLTRLPSLASSVHWSCKPGKEKDFRLWRQKMYIRYKIYVTPKISKVFFKKKAGHNIPECHLKDCFPTDLFNSWHIFFQCVIS